MMSAATADRQTSTCFLGNKMSMLTSTIAVCECGTMTQAATADVIAVRKYFAHMPRCWAKRLLKDKDFYLIDASDYELLDAYLKKLGFTGRPTYACWKCQCLYDCDMTWKWADTILENMRCATCGGQLASYHHEEQEQR